MKELLIQEQSNVLGGLGYMSYLGIIAASAAISSTTFLAYNFGSRTGFDKGALEIFKLYPSKQPGNELNPKE